MSPRLAVAVAGSSGTAWLARESCRTVVEAFQRQAFQAGQLLAHARCPRVNLPPTLHQYRSQRRLRAQARSGRPGVGSIQMRAIGSMCVAVAYLDEVLAFGLGDKWLKLRCREGVYQSGLGHHKQ